MSKKVLITGGAGFIGSHLADYLSESSKNEVTIFDQVDQDVYEKKVQATNHPNKIINYIQGSVNEYEKFEDLIKDSDIILHLAAKVGVGQSMYEIRSYTENNILGTANLLNILVNSEHDVKKVVITSSNTVYGEGKASCKKCGIFLPDLRSLNQLNNKGWELKCPNCGNTAKPLLTDENTPFNPSSVYALSKKFQEEISLMIGNTYGINVVILRLFLVYGPRQDPLNPYTGVCAIFSTRLLNGKRLIVFEDGLQSRDFVNVKDVCQAFWLSMNSEKANGEIFNVGTGIPITIKEVAETLTDKINPRLKPVYNQQYRVGDIRHCIADISKIKNKLGYEPKVSFDQGIEDYINWIKSQQHLIQDKTDKAIRELKSKNLLK